MAKIAPRIAASNYAAVSSYDFTNSGANLEATLVLVKLDSNAKVTLATASSDKIIGVIRNLPAVGDTADVLLINQMGTGSVQTGGSISVGDYLTTNSSGQAVTATQTTAGSQPTVHVFGQAVQAATGSGQEIEFISMDFLY